VILIMDAFQCKKFLKIHLRNC